MSNIYHLTLHSGELVNDNPDFSAEGLGAFIALLMTNDTYAEHVIAASTEQ